jgi:hypothetical protein
MKKINITVACLFIWCFVYSQPVIPSASVKLISYQGNIIDGSRLIAINQTEKASNGQIQNITKKQSEDGSALATTSSWNLIHKGGDIFLIQNASTKKYLGINKKYAVPPPSWSNQTFPEEPGSAPRGWFVYLDDIRDSTFYWYITYHKQHKGGDVQYYKFTEPYDAKFQSGDVFNIINASTSSRLSSVNVNGLMHDDYVQRVSVQSTAECYVQTLNEKRMSNGSNNEWDSRWYIAGARQKTDVKAYTLARGSCTPIVPAGGTGNAASSNTNNQTNNTGVKPPPKPPGNNTPPDKPPTVVITPPTPQNNDAKDVLGNWRLTETETTIIINGKRKKVPALLGGLMPKLELKFTSNGEVTIRNPNNNDYSKYNWKYYGQNRLDLTPIYRNEGDEEYLGTVSFNGNRMVYTVITKENGQTRETIYTYNRF